MSDVDLSFLQLCSGGANAFEVPKKGNSEELVTELDALDVVEIAIKHHASDLTTKAMALVALLKLSSRFPSCLEYDLDFFMSITLFLKMDLFLLSCLGFRDMKYSSISPEELAQDSLNLL
ncbi:hypothetical protein RIF29_04093 [Crotalaria pallida]|uniref:Uncharacterized protein n=1 Tax=Crotalaria pallida TaxID=3830 RepID=A0AAN9P9N6_CROPI